MSSSPEADNEFARLVALRTLHLLDTPAEERFDRITRTASAYFDVPIALVNLVDANRLWFKSCIGLPGAEAQRGFSFCSYTILHDEPLVIPDTLADPRFAGNSLVTEDPFIRFYAGKPLKATTGERVGTLCVMDRRPHSLDAAGLQVLHDLAVWAENELNSVQMSQALAIKQESEERVRAIMDTALDGIITIDDNGAIWAANPAALRLFGLNSGELLGQHFRTLLHADADHPIPLDTRAREAARSESVVGTVQELLGRRHDGMIFPIEVAVSEMQLPQDRFFVAVVRDITERREAEAALRLRNQAMADARNGILMTEAGGTDNPIVYVNPAFETITGYSATDVLGRDCRFLQGPDTDPRAVATIRAAIQEARSCIVTLINYRKDGTPFWQELSISPMRSPEGRLTHFIGVQADVTDRIKAQEAIERERERAERLLLNILPAAIAERLKRDGSVIADGYTDVSVLFADIVNFTSWASARAPADVVVVLNEIFSAFDQLTDQHGVEKIKMIGDGYMTVAGVPVPRSDHAEAVADLALGMQEIVQRIRPGGHTFELRVGIASGPVTAGVIGQRKFAYDLWGDTINVASRMESSGQPGRIQVAEETYSRLRSSYQFEPRGEVAIKGKGRLRTYTLLGRR